MKTALRATHRSSFQMAGVPTETSDIHMHSIAHEHPQKIKSFIGL